MGRSNTPRSYILLSDDTISRFKIYSVNIWYNKYFLQFKGRNSLHYKSENSIYIFLEIYYNIKFNLKTYKNMYELAIFGITLIWMENTRTHFYLFN